MTTAMRLLRYNRAQVALMVRVAIFYSIDSLQDTTGHSRRELRDIASQKTPPTRAVLNYFRLKPKGSVYVWNPALEYKSNPCWGPILRKPTNKVISAGRAIHLGVRTVESSFTTVPNVQPQ